MNVDEAHLYIQDHNPVVIDIRDKLSFENGHIASAIHIDDSNIEDFCATAELSQPVICCCYHGNSSRQAAQYLESKGFSRVFSMDGGMEEWKQKYPIVSSKNDV